MVNPEFDDENGEQDLPSGRMTSPVEGVRLSNGRIRLGLFAAVLGFFIFLLGAEPGLFRQDRSPVTGFVQISVFLVGQGIICLGGFATLNTLWNGRLKSIIYDIGLRLVATGYVISVASGMADIFGFGSEGYPTVPRFGAWQKVGVLGGQLVIALGFLMMIPYPRWMRVLRLKGVRRMRNSAPRTRPIRHRKDASGKE